MTQERYQADTKPAPCRWHLLQYARGDTPRPRADRKVGHGRSGSEGARVEPARAGVAG